MAGPLAALRTYLGLAPKELPKFVRVDLAFTASINSIDFGLIDLAENAVFSTVQSVWVENYGNPNMLIISAPGSEQEIRVSANSAGMFPLIASGAQKLTARTVAGVVTAKLLFLNVPQPYFTYTPF